MTVKSQKGPGQQEGYKEVRVYVKDGSRIGRETLYMEVARLFSARSTCVRGQVGCVAVRDNHIICAGYNGSPPGMAHCLDVGCGGAETTWAGKDECGADKGFIETFPNGCTRSIHAESNMVAFAARSGVALEGAQIFSTHGPCLPCAQLLVAVGIYELWYETPYRLPNGLELIDKANIRIVEYGKQ